MASLAQAAAGFLAQRRIAVVGVSRDRNQPANLNLRKLREAGHEVMAVNPSTAEAEGGTCYPSLSVIPGGVDAALIFTPPAATPGVVRECAELGIRYVWIHRSFGPGSWSPEAETIARERGLVLIPGGCPMMFGPPVDPGHRCMRWVLELFGRLPREIASDGKAVDCGSRGWARIGRSRTGDLGRWIEPRVLNLQGRDGAPSPSARAAEQSTALQSGRFSRSVEPREYSVME